MQHELALANQFHENLRLVAAEVFGGGKSRAAEGDLVPQTKDDLASIIAAAGGAVM